MGPRKLKVSLDLQNQQWKDPKFRNKDCQHIGIINSNIYLGNESKVQGDETSGNDNLLPAFKLGDIIFQTALKMH